jgi:hypothetical protein
MKLKRVEGIEFVGSYEFQPVDVKFFRKFYLEVSHANLFKFKLKITVKKNNLFEYHFISKKRNIHEAFHTKRGLIDGLLELKAILMDSENFRSSKR